MVQVLLDAVYLHWMGNYGWLNDVYATLPTILYAIMAVVGGAGSVYSIILGVNLAKSESDEKRRYAAYRLRNTLIGVAILIVLVLFINLGLPALLRAFTTENVDWEWRRLDGSQSSGGTGGENAETIIRPLLALFS